VTVTFPIHERTETYVVNQGTPVEETYECQFRGSTAISVQGASPLKTNDLPLYRDRDSMRTTLAPVKKSARFLAERRFGEW